MASHGLHPSLNSSDIPVELISSDNRFVSLKTLKDVLVDLKYAGVENFAGFALYENIDCCWLHHEAARGLSIASGFLKKVDGQCSLLVLDALRPQRVQESIWRQIHGTHIEDYFADPVKGSIHSYGMAVDVTLVDRFHCQFDMGSHFDQMDELSHPSLEGKHFEEGRLTSKHLSNRKLLRSAMMFGGFRGIDTEWWHFDFGDKTIIRAMYPRVV